MKILIKKEQLYKLGNAVEKLIMLRYGDILCDTQFDVEPDDESVFWVNLYFKEKWYDSLNLGFREVRAKSKQIIEFVNLIMGVKIRTGISLKEC